MQKLIFCCLRVFFLPCS